MKELKREEVGKFCIWRVDYMMKNKEYDSWILGLVIG